ncbi:MAG: flagellar hook basal-body protein [Bryobacteraceae bacterium]|nr:flagellar hook basal-body protein [Bryobacteraceae bacterium]
MESLDLLANNLANAGTPGFKPDREAYTLYASDAASLGNPAGGWMDWTKSPLIESSWTDHSQGALIPTSNPLDLALEGPGWLAVQHANGVRYTRSGNLRLSAEGNLVTADGFPVRNKEDGGPIRLRPGAAVEVDASGRIRQRGESAGQLELVEANGEQMGKEGHTYFRFLPPGSPRPAAEARVRQGYLEGSNANPSESATRLISILRQFEMLERAVALGQEMNRRAAEEVARVS